ncbi:MAG: PQQ-binding-like beta-propeller repeat protein, partial [Phycisphaerae bacterium]
MKNVIITIFLMLVALATCVRGAELLVPSQYPTIQSAISAAVNGDTVIVADGIYTGPGNYNIDFLCKAITVRSENGPESCIIDCDGLGVGFDFHQYEDANLDGFTITNASIGAIRCYSSSPTITNCIISGNTGMYGGGIYCYSRSNPIITNCTITGNSAHNYGGGIYCGYSSSPTIANCTITGNTVVNYGNGGGIYCENNSSPKITNCNITSNATWRDGGGIYYRNSSPTITSCIIAENTAGRDGGGIHGNTFRLMLTNCTIAGNSAGGNGGGLFACQGQITNCIIWDNAASAYPQLYDSVEPTYSCIQDWTAAGIGNINDDPCFAAPGDYHLLFNSPCIDTGNPLYTSLGKTDIDGQPRVIGTCIDMGADEYGKMIIVTEPVEGEVWATGSEREIEWTQFGVTSVDILLSTDAGANWQTIAEGITGVASYLWELPNHIDSNQCVISVLPGDGDANVISIDSELFTIKPYPHRPAVPPGWQHWGKLPGPDLSDNKGPLLGCVKWIFDTNGPVSSQVAVTRSNHHGYRIYVGCEDGVVYALNDDGELLWSYDINTPIVGSPAVGYYGMVYVAGKNGWLYAIDDDGDVRWTQTTDAPVYSAPVVDCSGKIYVSSEDGLIYAFDADGSELWTFETKGPGRLNGAILTTPVIEANGAVYISGFYDPNLYALDADTGSVNWACLFASADDPNNSMAGRLFAAPAVGADGTIYQTLIDDPNLYTIDPCTGDIIWTTSLRLDPNTYSSGWSSPVVGPDGTIYVGFDDPYLRAVNPDGTIKWITRLGMVGGFTLTVDKNGFIYAASDDGYVCVVNAEGEEVSRFEGNGWVSFPAIAEDGTLIVSDSNNRVWAISARGCGGQPSALH